MTYTKPFIRLASAVVVPAAMLINSASHAQVLGELWQNQPGSIINDATIANQPAGAPDAEFNTTAINYDSRVAGSGYTPNLFLHSPTFFNTSGGFNANGSLDNTYFLFTGKTYLNAGANTFVTPHDDGFELSIPGASFDLSQPGPTAPVATSYTVNAPSAGLYDFTLSYAECCGAPAVLAFEVNGTPVGNVPEVSSTLGLLGIGFGALGLLRGKVRR